MSDTDQLMSNRFRGFLPVVVDVETGGFDHHGDALLEVAVCPILMRADGHLEPGGCTSTHIIPFDGANMDPKSLEVNGIDPWHPLRAAREEKDGLIHVCKPIREEMKATGCKRAILVGHNAAFDLNFWNAAIARTGYKRNPFHPFSALDTVSLGALAHAQTVLSRIAVSSGLEWSAEEAHSAVYDTLQTARVFCSIFNQWHDHIGIPQSQTA